MSTCNRLNLQTLGSQADYAHKSPDHCFQGIEMSGLMTSGALNLWQGVTSVRAFGAEKRMRDQFMAMVDANHRPYVLFVHIARWLGVRLDFVAAICVAFTAILVVILRHTLSPGIAGTSNHFFLSCSTIIKQIIRMSITLQDQPMLD